MTWRPRWRNPTITDRSRSRPVWAEIAMKNFGLSGLTAANPRQGAQFDQRAAAAVLDPSPAAMRMFALSGVICTAGIIATGAAVRLSESGLGCPDWPECTRSSLAAGGDTGDPLIHRWIEFGNRLVTVAIFVVAIGVTIAAWRFRPAAGRRKDLLWLAVAQPVSIVLQALLGGLLVITKLNP